MPQDFSSDRYVAERAEASAARTAAATPGVSPAKPPRYELSAEEKLSGDMLMLTTAFMIVASMLWLAVYKTMGYDNYSTTIPFIFMGLSAATMVLWLRYRRLYAFTLIQLGLILFAPFVMQWSIGNFVNSSGVSLWGLMAPVGAVTVLGTRQSIPWFFGWLFMTVMAGVFDYMLSTGGPQRFDQQTVAVFFVLNFAAISVMIYALLWYFASEKQKLREMVDASFREVSAEKERSERLLLNVLPPAIAERLKRGEAHIAQGHADVTVMFADIVGFTRISEELSPADTVRVLNDVFSLFDELADRHGVEKIKTVGDAYMAAAGLESGATARCTESVARMALEMVARVAEYRERSGEDIHIRVGLGSGPVVAGVIGKKKFIYDMWGDTVNVAFRMAGEAGAGVIQVDPATRRRLQARFRFGEPQVADVKGKGRMELCALLAER